MKRNFLLVAALCFAALILTSCNKEKGEQNDFVKLSVRDALNSERDVFLSEIASSIEYIPLETSDKSLIANLLRPHLIDGTFYIIDNKWKDIKRFSRD
ncbi:MAG: 6-bladed beta-propeller, partial [Bacteroidales bacterium]|nr:6-bladed beta-propeller [Bacteroidales bacterium]